MVVIQNARDACTLFLQSTFNKTPVVSVHNSQIQGWAMKRENFKTLKKSKREFFICLLVINEKHMNSHFVLCQFENLCFENNALKMASVSMHAFLKSGPETIGGFKTANSRWSGRNSRGDAARGHEQFQVPTWGMRALRRKPSWGPYFQNTNFQTGIKQNDYSYAFHLWPINR